MRKIMFDYGKVRNRYLKTHKVCKVCFDTPGEWRYGTRVEIHHIRGKLGSLREDERGFLPVCRRHHIMIDNNKEWARSHEYLCEKGRWHVPFENEEFPA